MRVLRSALSKALLGLLVVSTVGMGGPITRSPRPQAVARVRPVALAGSHWKANVRTLVARPRGRIAVGRRSVIYPPPRTSIDALLARRALNPGRFDRLHPALGRILGRLELIRTGVTCGPGGGLIFLTPYHQYLIRRRALNPARFDHFHPILGLLLAEDARLRALPCPQVVTPPGGTPGGGSVGGVDVNNPQAVPEPSTLWLGLLALIGGAWACPRFGRTGPVPA